MRTTSALVLAALLPLPACGGAGGPTSPDTPGGGSAARVRVTIDTARPLRTVDAGRVLGGNLAAWVAPGKLAGPTGGYVVERGARLLRFPGGNLANSFCWPQLRASDKNLQKWDDWSWGTGVEPYLAFLDSVGGEPMYSLNPFDHVIDGRTHRALDEARALVRLLVSRGYAGAFYEVGNENDGSWNPMLSPAQYVERFVEFAEAVKREDPSAKLLGPVGSGTEPAWRDGFIDGLAARGKLSLLDQFSFHYYGGWISNSNSAGIDLNGPQRLAGHVAAIRERLAARGGAGIGVALTEWNAAIWDTGATRGQYTIEQALWLADAAGTLFRSVDVGNVWIDLTAEDPHGLLSDRSSPPARTKNYWPVAMAGRALGLARREPQVDVLDPAVDLPPSRLTAYAVRGRDGAVGLLLVNKGDALSAEIALNGRGCSGVTAQMLDGTGYAAGNGPAGHAVSCSSGTLATELPKSSLVALLLL